MTRPTLNIKTRYIRPDKEVSPEGEDLAGELQQLLLMSVNARNKCGATADIQNACLRERCDDENSLPEYPVEPDDCSECSCEAGEMCDLCEKELADICSVEEAQARQVSPFSGLGNMFATIKVYDYIALAEQAYAPIGNKPFKLESNKKIEITDPQKEELSAILEQSIDAYIDEFDVRINEIPQAFNFAVANDMVDALKSSMIKDSKDKNDAAIREGENIIERIFNRTNFMKEYLEVIKDTANYPIGVMWIDDSAVKKQKVFKNGKVKIDYKMQSSAERVEPAHCWFTPDHTLHNFGRAAFRLKRFTRGEINSWQDMNVAGSAKLEKNVREFLAKYPDGGVIPHTMLFRNLNPIIDVDYDIMIGRGKFLKEHIKDLGVEVPESMKNENYIPCEIHFAGSYILRVKAMEVMDDRLGVYTTLFRRNGNSLFGYSVYDFTYPFAGLYENTLDAIDRGVSKSIGSFIQVDRSVIIDPEKYFKRDEKTQQIILDISEDNIIEFDSAEAFGTPNFKGFPITVTELPSNLEKLIPMLNLIVQEMERITKIPTLLTDASSIPSALRTTENFNAAFEASANVIKALLRESETRVLSPSILYMWDSELLNGRLSEDLLDLEPEILLSDTLTRELNTDLEMLQDFIALQGFRDIIPPEKFGALLNTVAREVFDHEEDLIPDVGVLSINKPQAERLAA